MEVKSVYLDLQKAEPKKRGNKTVWKLESEAFKEPLELKIGYDNQELKEFNNQIEWLSKSIKLLETNLDHEINSSIYKAWQIWDLGDRIKLQDWVNAKLNEKIEENKSEIKSLYKVIADLKTTVETLSGTIIQLQEWMRLIEKKITKQPRVFSDKTFISGRERSGLSVIEIPSGDYLVISKYVIGEHNEFVTNENDVIFEKITVSDNHYIPMYQLVGGTELDTPTATIYRDLILIPC